MIMTFDRRLIAMVFCAATCAATCAVPAASPPVAFFSSGDRLPGTITDIKGAKARFQSPVLIEPATIHLSKLLELRSQAATPEINADYEAIVTLTNGNVLRGQLGDLDDKSIILDTWYAGRLTLRRTMVESLRVIDRTLSIYSGPRGPEGWVFSGGDEENPPWSFDGTTMISRASGGAARKFDLPDRVAVSFDLAWSSTLRFDLAIFSDDLEVDRPANCYLLSFNRSYAQFTKYSDSGPQPLGNNSVRGFFEKEKVHVELFADRADHIFFLAIDGKRIATWRDPNPVQKIKGDGIHFVAQDPSSTIRVSRIDIRAWDGRIEDENASGADKENEESVPPGSQRIRLRNGDIVTGKVLGVENEHLAIDTPHGTIHLPIGRMARVMLHREDEKNTASCHQPKWMTGDVKAWFPEGGNVVFRLDGIENDQYIGFSQIFGTARFRRDAFSRVELNIYDAALEPLRPAAAK